jgi:hypothetical protein
MNNRNELAPIGIMPHFIWWEKRFEELSEGIKKRVEGGFPIPGEWVKEYNQMIKFGPGGVIGNDTISGR